MKCFVGGLLVLVVSLLIWGAVSITVSSNAQRAKCDDIRQLARWYTEQSFTEDNIEWATYDNAVAARLYAQYSAECEVAK